MPSSAVIIRLILNLFAFECENFRS